MHWTEELKTEILGCSSLFANKVKRGTTINIVRQQMHHDEDLLKVFSCIFATEVRNLITIKRFLQC